MSKSNWPAPTMMLTTSAWAHTESFSLIPISNDCPYVEVLYNPTGKTLAIIGKSKKETFHMIPRLDDNGHPVHNKIPGPTGETVRKQRVQQESYSEYYLTNRDEIEAFIKAFAVNHEEFNYKKTLDMQTMSDPDTIAKGPQLIIEP